MDSAGDDESQSGELTLTQVLVSGPLAFPTGVVACFAPSGLIWNGTTSAALSYITAPSLAFIGDCEFCAPAF